MVSSLGSAAVPPPGEGDHVRGDGPLAVLYLDLACPRCAGSWGRISALPLRLCVRHFPVASKRPRSPALHHAAEAVAAQSEPAFWDFWDSLLGDRAYVDDPHLWERVRAMGLDLERFQADRRSESVIARVDRDFRSGIRAGVTGTPAGFAGTNPLGPDLEAGLEELCLRGERA
ncbi:MAG: DsbA family protein [Solirubrobacterales bacterium]|nr:DsbA family protein [Solirubrobacterales bacterium]